MVVRCHEKILDEVLIDGLHSLDSLSAAILALEIVHGHSLDVSKIGHGNYSVIIRDQVFHGHIIIKADLCPSVITIFLGDHEDLFLDHT